jgi:hypothetical protein
VVSKKHLSFYFVISSQYESFKILPVIPRILIRVRSLRGIKKTFEFLFCDFFAISAFPTIFSKIQFIQKKTFEECYKKVEITNSSKVNLITTLM